MASISVDNYMMKFQSFSPYELTIIVDSMVEEQDQLHLLSPENIVMFVEKLAKVDNDLALEVWSILIGV